MATHSSILAWKIPRTAEPNGLLSMGLQRVGHNWLIEHTHTQISKDKESVINIMKHDLFVIHRTTPTKVAELIFF